MPESHQQEFYLFDEAPLAPDLATQILRDGVSAGDPRAITALAARQFGVPPEQMIVHVRVDDEVKRSGKETYRITTHFDGLVDPTRLGPEYQDLDDVFNSPPLWALQFATSATNTEIAPFSYEPLDVTTKEIRLLRLGLVCEHGLVLQLHIQTFALDDAPSFLALSYVWGPPHIEAKVKCGRAGIGVGASLLHALLGTFRRYPSGWLWADAICIDQSNLTERAHQVMIMGDIYRKATLVVAHPGSGHDKFKCEFNEAVDCSIDCQNHQYMREEAASSGSPQKAISVMNHLTRIWKSSTGTMSDLDWAQHIPDITTKEGKEMWANAAIFWLFDWYSRAWILQEVVLPDTVLMMVDEAIMNLDDLLEFWELAKSSSLPKILRLGWVADRFTQAMNLSPITSFKSLRERRKAADHAPNNQGPDYAFALSRNQRGKLVPYLLELLRLSKINLASDPRDKIYALLGMAEDEISRSIVADYSPENTATTLYIDIARGFIDAGFGVDTLHLSGLDQTVQDLPSWAPDWTKQSRSELKAALYHCTGSTSPNMELFETSGKPGLRVRGTILAILDELGPAWRYYSHSGKWNEPVPLSLADQEWPKLIDEDARNSILSYGNIVLVQRHNLERYAKEGLEVALARTLTADTFREEGRTGISESTAVFQRSAESAGEQASSANAEISGQEFLDSYAAFRRFYNRGPEEDTPPETRVHQTGQWAWLMDFDEETEERLQSSLTPFATAMQRIQRGRRLATLSWAPELSWSTSPSSECEDETAEDVSSSTGRDAEDHKTTDPDKSELLATIPWNAMADDLVVLLEGFHTPFVFRPCPDQNDNLPLQCQVVGDCYVHGVMDGEMLFHISEAEAEKLASNQFSVDSDGRFIRIKGLGGFANFLYFKLV